MSTRVIHIRNAPPGWEQNPDYVYIGRAGHGFSGEYGNPHVLGWCSFCGGRHEREGVVEAFKLYARARRAADPDWRALVEKLRGKWLVCFCKPKDCHGDVYVELLDEKER